jgi:hypothetical protein
MGELVHLTRGVWRPRLAVTDLAGRVAAVLSVYPADTVVCGLTAARLHGLWLPSDEVCVDEPIELIIHPGVPVPADRVASRRSRIRARRQVLARDEIAVVDGVPVTSDARTWLDLAQQLSLPDLVAAGDSALRGTATAEEIDRVLRRATHRRGVVKARTAALLLDVRSRSRPESHLRYALVSNGLPKPDVNKAILTEHGEWLAEPDLSYRDVRLALEYNGRKHANEDRMRRDLTRGVDVSIAGWRTESFGPREVFNRPDQIAALVRRLRQERAHLSRTASR